MLHGLAALFAVGTAGSIAEVQGSNSSVWQNKLSVVKANLNLASVWNSSVACFLAKCEIMRPCGGQIPLHCKYLTFCCRVPGRVLACLTSAASVGQNAVL